MRVRVEVKVGVRVKVRVRVCLTSWEIMLYSDRISLDNFLRSSISSFLDWVDLTLNLNTELSPGPNPELKANPILTPFLIYT